MACLGYPSLSKTYSPLRQIDRSTYTFWTPDCNHYGRFVASAALKDTPSIQEFVKRNADTRQEFLNQGMARTLRPIDSHAKLRNDEHS